MRTRLAVGVLTLGLATAGCGGGEDTGPFRTDGRGPDPVTASSAPTPAEGPRVVGDVATGLEVPWGIGFLPDGSALVTERDKGDVLHVVPGPDGTDATVTRVGEIGESQPSGEGGLLGIAVSPTYEQDQRVFLYTSTDSDNRILSATYADGRLSDPEPILTGIPLGGIHDGGRLAFGPDGYLYASTGETGDDDLAQDPDSLGGKILRITPDGKPAPGNPDPDSPVWTIGHRNVQGLAFDAGKRLWASEFGASDWDELNLITEATNYGWPEVEGMSDQDRFRNPEVVWRTSDASPSGLAFSDGHLWMGALRGGRLWRITVDGTRATDPTDFFVGTYGRLRSVATAPDGRLWLTTSNRDGRGEPKAGDDRILLVDPT